MYLFKHINMTNQLKFSFILLFSIQVSMSSCINKILLNSLGVFEKKASKKYLSNGEKKIVFFEMHHVGKKVFYDNIKLELDSLMEKGYMVYFEGVRIGVVNDSLLIDTIYRKARKITGVDFVSSLKNKGYLDTLNKTAFGKKSKLITKYKLVNQPHDIVSKTDTLRSKNVDATFYNLINACETKFGPIVLDSIDFETKFGEKYKTPKKSELREYFLLVYRNDLITNSILHDQSEKIVLLYGKKHFDGILENLQKVDKNYKEVENF